MSRDSVARGMAGSALAGGSFGAFSNIYPSFTAGSVDFTPAATPTDVAVLICQNYGRVVKLRRVVVSGIATSTATINVLLQKSVNGGGGTQVAMEPGKADLRDSNPTGKAYHYTANRTSNGDGVSSTRPIIAAGRLTFATATTVGEPCVFEFGADGEKTTTLRDLISWVVVNLQGQTMPSGAKLSVTFEWWEERQARIAFAGDSTTSNASFLFSALGDTGWLNSFACIENLGSNGFRLTDFINNTNGVTYPMSQVLSRYNDVLVLCYGINDVRQGATTEAQLVSMIDAVIHATLNGTTSGETYTSPVGARTTFTWPSTMQASPDCKIILWGPNSLLADDPGATGFVPASGIFAGLSQAERTQLASEILYDAYQAFDSDPRIHALVQKQELFGQTVATKAANIAAGRPWWTDILHPNERGQVLSARQIAPVLRRASQKALEFYI